MLRLAALWLAVASAGCGAEIVPDVATRLHLKEVYHESPFTYRAAFDLTVASDLWGDSHVQTYDTTDLADGYWGEEFERCGVEIIRDSQHVLSESQWPLEPDQNQDHVGFVMDIKNGDLWGPSAVGLQLFDSYYNIIESPDVVPVFVFPNLMTVVDGAYSFRGVQAIAFEDDSYGSLGYYVPSIWLNSRLIDSAPTPSTLAHEIAHVVLPENWLVDPWGDNKTPILNIQDWLNQVRYTRVGPSSSHLTQVTSTDANRRVLIEVALPQRNQCKDAKASRFVRPEPINQ